MKFYKNLAYYNGEYGELEDMKVPMSDRVCFFGDGVYDATIAGNGIIHDLEDHIDRFFNSAALLDIKISVSKEELAKLLKELILMVDPSIETVMVYFQVTRGSGIRKHAFPGPEVKSNLWVIFSDYGKIERYKHTDTITFPDKRFEYCNIKTLNLIPSVLAAQAAASANVGETIFIRPGNIVTECAHSNISFLKDGRFITHPQDEYILPGRGLANLIKKCGQLGIEVEERTYTLSELLDADEVIISASGSFCTAVDHIDGASVGGKDRQLLEKLQDELMDDYLREIGKL